MRSIPNFEVTSAMSERPTPTATAAARTPQRGARRAGALALAAVLVLAACGDDEAGSTAAQTAPDAAADGAQDTGPDAAPDAAPDAPVVVATTSIWADIVGNVACDGLVRVETIIPIGGDPHAFEPSLADRETLEGAALVVANGLFLEEGLEDTIAAAEESGAPVFRVADHLPTLPVGAADHDEDHAGDKPEDEHADDEHAEDEHADEGHAEDEHADEGHDHEHTGDDPHVWFDPTGVSAMVPALADALVESAGIDAEAVDACVAAYQAELAAVDGEIVDVLAAVPDDRRLLVTSHDALAYFAHRYGFEVLGTVIPAPSSLAQTNPADLEALATLIEESGVPAVFAETQHSAEDTEALADRVGDIEVVTLFTGSLGEPGSGAETYVDFLRTNAGLIADALG